MKKFSLILALLAALSFVFFACDDGGGGGGKKKVEGEGWTHDLGAFQHTLTGNFTYGHGYQGNLVKSALFAGDKITQGEEYTLEIDFTVNRAVPVGIQIGLVDRTAAASYWTQLSWTSDDDAYNTGPLTASTPYSLTIPFTALRSATANTLEANDLTFQTGTEDDPELSTDGNVVLTITKFVFKKGDGGEGPIEPPPPTYVPNPVVTAQDYTVKLEGLTMKNETPTTAAWNNIWFNLSEAFPAGFDISKYNAFTVKAKFYDADDAEIPVANSLGALNFTTGSNPWDGSGVWLIAANVGNLGTADTEEVELLEGAGFFDQTPAYLYAQNANVNVKYIEITQITFHWGTRAAAPLGPSAPVGESVPTGGYTEAFRITLADKGDYTNIWDWDDSGTDYLKGRIKVTKATEIKALTNGKFQLYWISGSGTDVPANGIGAFGGVNYNAPGGTAAGLVEGDISDLELMTGGDAGKLFLNTYNGGDVLKVIFYRKN